MSWRRYSQLFMNGKRDDAYFVLGIDLGNAASAIAYFDVNRLSPETLDISGGYGKPTMPSAMQYVADTKEWVFGEYALNVRNGEADINVSGLLSGLGKKQFIQIDRRPVSYSELLTMYLKELIGSCKNLNPKAEIAGIVAAVPCYVSDEAREELSAVFDRAGYGKALISFVDERECVLARYLYNKEIADTKILLIDFGALEIRGGVYSVNSDGDMVKATSISSIFDAGLGTNHINHALYRYFEGVYCKKFGLSADKLSTHIKEQLENFTYQHKDVLFQKAPNSGSMKLYFNFAYPPFEISVDYRTIEKIIEPYRLRFGDFLRDVFSKTSNSTQITASSVSSVICCGGGFEAFWARNFVKAAFAGKKEVFFKNSTTAAAEGASIIAAHELKLIKQREIELVDMHRLPYDIGVRVVGKDKPDFVPLIERDSFWWQERLAKSFILADATDKEVLIDICRRDREGRVEKLDEVMLVGLPKRPPLATKLTMSMEFIDAGNFVASVKDAGFGELFPASQAEREYVVSLV